MNYSKEDFDLGVEAIWQEYKTNPVKISHPQSLLSAALPVASHNYPKEKDGIRINFDPTQIVALKAIPNQQIRSIIYSLGAREKVLKNCSPGKTVASGRPMTIPAFIPDDPLRFSLIIYDSFEKWYAGYQQIKNKKFEDIDPENLLYIYDLALLINQKIQLTAAPSIVFDLGYTPKLEELCNIEKHSDLEERRKEILEYLQHRKIIDYWLSEYQNYGGDMSSGNKVNVTVLTKNWTLFFQEIQTAYEKSTKQKSPVKAIALSMEKGSPIDFKVQVNTKWEDITIKFRDGHNVNIKIGQKSFPSDFKIMGFEDKKRRLPNLQWDFLQLLANRKGILTWQDSDASDSLKKKKQLLADTLKAYFQIDEDPFYPYKQEKAYKIKITLIPE